MNTAVVLRSRRTRVFEELGSDRWVLLHNGAPQHRNITAAAYPFRPNSHFLHLFGVQPPGALALLGPGRAELYIERRTREEIVWEGEPPSPELLQAQGAFDAVYPRSALDARLASLGRERVLTIQSLHHRVNAALAALLGRAPDIHGADAPLARAMISSRLVTDEAALEAHRDAIAATAQAFAAGRRAAAPGATPAEILAEMEAALLRKGMRTSFNPVVSTRGDILHHDCLSREALQEGELLLVDFGAETAEGYAADVTRTWPVSGRLDEGQQQIYDIVLSAQRGAIAAVRPGMRFLEVHRSACRAMAEGLRDAGILRLSSEEAVACGAHTLFFPHGIGHLLGLDVHDMEDLGDLAGYPEGRTRSTEFGLAALRLDRDLAPGMLVTIEPGIYFIDALLDDPARRERYGRFVNWDLVDKLRPLRGIRIEDDVLVTEQGAEVLTGAIPK